MSFLSRPRPSRALMLAALAVVLAVGLAAPLQAASDPTYAALRNARPDGRKIPVQSLVLERDAFRFQLDSGALYLLAPVEGHTIGAVFVGQGSYRLSPATPNESRQLAISSGAGADKGFEALTDSFDNLLLLFTDGTGPSSSATPPSRPALPIPTPWTSTSSGSSGSRRTSGPTSTSGSSRTC